MRPRLLIASIIGAIALAALAVVGALAWLAAGALPEEQALRSRLLLYAGGGILALCSLLAGAWWLLERLLARPLQALTEEIRKVAHSKAAAAFSTPAAHGLGDLPAAMADAAERLIKSRRETAQAMRAATARAEEQITRLEGILRDLSEGVLVCSPDHRIVLFNEAAVRIVKSPDKLGLGRLLFDLVTREPVLHTLERLQYRLEGGEGAPELDTASFVCATIDSRTMLQGQMTLILDHDRRVSGYALTVTDISKQVAELGKRDALLRAATEGLRRPVANLRAAAETMVTHPGLSPAERAAFEQVVFSESVALSDRLERLAAEYHCLIAGPWPMSDLYSADLFRCVSRHLKDAGIEVTLVGLPLWLRGDSHALMLAIEYLIRRIHERSGTQAFDLETLMHDRRTYVDIIWEGEPVPLKVLDEWLDAPLENALGGTAREIFEHHNSSLWSQAHDRRPEYALVRMPLAGPLRGHIQPPRERPPPRPEFYDFDLMHGRRLPPDLAKRALRDLTYVAFDTETTGLRPSAGDEIVSIAGVRVVNGRILTGETFERLVNPQRRIPRSSTRFHGIVDEMVTDKPPLHVVLPQFRTFVGDSVLVAHNAAFDMKFLSLKEAAAGVRFDNPVIDTLLLSVYLHDDTADHALEGLAERFGIDMDPKQRHTALGDSMATAAIFLHLLELLEARGIATLGEALKAAGSVVAVRRAQAQF